MRVLALLPERPADPPSQPQYLRLPSAATVDDAAASSRPSEAEPRRKPPAPPERQQHSREPTLWPRTRSRWWAREPYGPSFDPRRIPVVISLSLYYLYEARLVFPFSLYHLALPPSSRYPLSRVAMPRMYQRDFSEKLPRCEPALRCRSGRGRTPRARCTRPRSPRRRFPLLRPCSNSVRGLCAESQPFKRRHWEFRSERGGSSVPVGRARRKGANLQVEQTGKGEQKTAWRSQRAIRELRAKGGELERQTEQT